MDEHHLILALPLVAPLIIECDVPCVAAPHLLQGEKRAIVQYGHACVELIGDYDANSGCEAFCHVVRGELLLDDGRQPRLIKMLWHGKRDNKVISAKVSAYAVVGNGQTCNAGRVLTEQEVARLSAIDVVVKLEVVDVDGGKTDAPCVDVYHPYVRMSEEFLVAIAGHAGTSAHLGVEGRVRRGREFGASEVETVPLASTTLPLPLVVGAIKPDMAHKRVVFRPEASLPMHADGHVGGEAVQSLTYALHRLAERLLGHSVRHNKELVAAHAKHLVILELRDEHLSYGNEQRITCVVSSFVIDAL